MMSKSRQWIRQLAINLARDNRRAVPSLLSVYWFPDDEEIRLVEVEDDIPPAAEDCVQPFYFDASPEVPAPSGIALVRSDEVGHLELPKGWGRWEDAERLEVSE